MAKLDQVYQNEIKHKLLTELKLKNIMSVPKLIKIVISVGLGEALVNKKVLDSMQQQIANISGQKAVITYAKQDISSFKLRKGDPIGLKVVLRRRRMYDFFEKLVKIVLPRIRDFRGVTNKSFDNGGNYTLGLSEQIIFPEIEYNQIDKVRGIEITFVTNTVNREHAERLLALLGLPFMKKANKG